MSSVVLSSDRLNLRKMGKEDVHLLMEIFSDPEAMRYYPSTKDEDGAMDWIHWTLDIMRNTV